MLTFSKFKDVLYTSSPQVHCGFLTWGR